MAGYVPVLLITANVGSIFEEPSVMLNVWTEEFLSTIARLDPKFIALHCQEVGGKNYEQSMRHVEYFVRLLMSSEELRLFDKVRVFLDEDFSSAEHFTALGNFYFVHESLKDVLLWDFKEASFVPVSGKDVHSGNIEAVTTKEKSKFPQDFFPECKWSRKGFLRTRWSISGTVLDLINIHLFHDASNFVAMETFPSVYSKTRRRALEHTLDRFHNDHYPNVPYFLFGDFNFRTDTAGVIKKLTEDTQESKLPNKNNFSKLQFHNKEDDLVLTLGKKEFSHIEHQHVFIENSGQWLREYDRELEDFEGRLLEFPINFIPSYPFEENIKEGGNYMKTRVPAWCDRVLLSPTAKTLAENTSASGEIEYGIIGPTTCMGDHKPVYLRIVLPSDAGTVNCCHLANAPLYCFQVPDSYVDTLSLLPDCRSYLSKPVHIDPSANFLHAAPVKHDPYTPDSMDSPSPRALVITGEVPELELLLDDCNEEESYYYRNVPRVSSVSKRMDTAVSPALLKSKLELIVQSKNQDSKKSGADIRKSPSECDVPSLSMADGETQLCTGVREKRSNSDVSWQRSHLLTRAWVQGRGHQAYDYFRSDSKHKSYSSSDSNEINIAATDLVIPRIAIITASNFESNESSVNLHDDRHSTYSETRLSTYSDNRTKTISGEASSLEKSDEICSRIFEDKVNINRDVTQFINVQDDTMYVSVPNIQLKQNFDGMYLVEDCGTRTGDIDNASDKLGKDSLSHDLLFNENKIEFTEKPKSRDNNNQYVPREREENENCESEKFNVTEKNAEGEVDSRENLFEIRIEGDGIDKIGRETKNMDRNDLEDDSEIKASVIPKILESQRGEVSVINENVNTYGHNVAIPNETDVLRSENNRDILGSRNTTRSNSTQSQDGNIPLGLTRRVTEKCKNDIVKEKGKSRRCCCVIS